MELLQEPAQQGEHAEGGSNPAPRSTPQVNPREHAHPRRGNAAGVCHGGRHVNHTSCVIGPLGHHHQSLMSTFPRSIGFSCLPIVCLYLMRSGASRGSMQLNRLSQQTQDPARSSAVCQWELSTLPLTLCIPSDPRQ